MVTRALAATGIFGLLVGTVLPGIFTALPAMAAPGINEQINFQGKVTNTNGTNVANGNYSFTFRIYSQQAPGGTAIWTETKTLAVNDGVFVTALGDTTSLPGSVDFNTDNIFLGIEFNSDGEMTPRIQFTAAAYAFNSDKLDGLDSSAFAQLNPGSAQTGSLNITGSLQAATSVQSPLVDTATAVGLSIGTGTASSVTIGRSTTPLALQGNASSTLAITHSGNTMTIGFAQPTANVNYNFAAAAAGTYTICTTDVNSCGSVYANAANYLAKNAQESTTASIAGNLLTVTNTNSGASSALALSGAGTNAVLSVTGSGNPSAGQATLLVNNTNATPSGNLIDLQTNGTSRFSVNTSGGVTATGLDNNSGGITEAGAISGATTVTASTALQAPLVDTSGAAALGVGTTNATSVTVGRATSATNLTLQGSASTTWSATGASGSTTVQFASPTATNTITFPNAGGTVCTTTASTCNTTYQAAGSYLLKNAQDSSSASVSGNLLSLTNNNGGGSGVLLLTNAGTGSALSVTTSASPSAGNALIYANNNSGTPAGNLMDLRSGGNSQYSVTALGAVTQAGGLTVSSGGIAVTGNSTIGGTLGGITGLTVVSGGASISGGLNNNNGNITNAGSISGATTIGASGQISTTANTTGLAVTGTPAAAATSSLIQVGGAIAGGNAAANGGTYLGLNAPGSGAGSAADFLNFQANGAIRLKVDINGNVTAGTYNGQTISSAASFTGTVSTAGALTAGGALTVSAGGANLTGGIDNNGDNITEAGAISGVTTITVGTAVQAPLLDTNGSGSLSIGTTNALDITVGRAGAPLTLQGNGSTTLKATSSGNTTTVGFIAPTGTNSINFPNAGGTICTTVASTCSGTYLTSGNFLAKNAQDSSSASVSGPLLTLTNNNGAGNALSLVNAGTNSALVVSSSSNAAAGQALILANNTNGSPSGNLIDLQTNGTSRFSVSSAGAVTSGTINGQTISSSASFTGTLATASTLTVSAGGLQVSAGGIVVSGNSSITGTLGGLTGLTVASGGANISGGINNNDDGITNAGAISGATTVTVSTSVQTPLVDVSAAALGIGTGTATSVNVGRASSSMPLTLQGSAGSTWSATGASGSTTLQFASPTAANTITIPNTGGTICTTVASTCSGTYLTAGSYMVKDAHETSSAAYAGNLIDLTNTSTGAAGVLSLTNSGTNSALSITSSGNPGSNQALIFANNSNASPSGNLIDLRAGGTTRFNVTSAGAATANTMTLQGSNSLTLGTTGTSTGSILFRGSTAASGTITLIGQANPTGTTITLPDETGVVCLRGSSLCNFMSGSATDFIQNQNSSAQTTANFWISGTGRSDTAVITPKLDTASAVALNIGDASSPTTSQINLNQNTSVAAGKSLTMASGTGSFSQTYTGTSTDAHTITANSLSTGSALKVVSANNSAANTSWSAVMLDLSNVQATTAVSGANQIAGLDVQLTQNAGVSGNNETVANMAVKSMASVAADSTVSSILNLANNDTATGNQITVTDALKINGANVTNGINLSGTFGTNLITSTNFSVSQGGAIVGVGLNSGTGLIQGTGGLTVTGATSVNHNANFATNINTGSSTGTVTIGGGSAPLVIDSTNFDVSSAGALSGITTITTSGTINTNTFTGSSLTFGSAATATVQSASGQTLQVGVTGNTLALRGDASTTLQISNGTNTTTIGFANPTANVVYNFGTAPASTYTVCTTYVSSCSATYAPAQDGAGYIQNDTAVQTSANFNIDGQGRIGTNLTLGATAGGGTSFGAGADLMFGNNADRTVKVLAAAASTAGKSLSIQAGDANGASLAGGNLVLQGGTAGSGGQGGSVIVKPLTNSVTAFMVQDSAASSNIFTVNTTGTGNVALFGTSTNGAIFESDYEMSLAGSARHVKTIKLQPEYAGAVLDAGGATSTNGTMTAGIDTTPNPDAHFYKWTSTQSGAQTYDVVVSVPIPEDWSAWNGNPTFRIYTNNNGANQSILVTVKQQDNTTDSNFNAFSISGAASWANNTWASYSGRAFAGTYAAGDVMNIRVRMSASSNNYVYLGDITLPYLSKW